MLFASLELEKEPMQWAELPAALGSWAQNAGGLAALCVVFWLLIRLFLTQDRQAGAGRKGRPSRRGLPWGFLLGLIVAVVAYGIYGALWVVELASAGSTSRVMRELFLTVASVAALLAIALPVLLEMLGRLHGRRIWALARLSLKEAIRSRVIFVFCGMALVFLFAGWFVPYKAEDQVRNYVRIVYWSLAPLFLVTASLLGSLSIPADVKSQSIHTIVTKPVERFEIVLGRFLGYGILLSVALVVLATLSLLYLVRGISPEAKQESFKARVPLFGKLQFHGTKSKTEGENVGREWGYRSYIGGRDPRVPNQPQPYAVWQFASLPTSLGSQTEPVRFEFTFDIFRMTKGDENRGVFCTFTLADGSLTVPEVEQAVVKMRQERDKLMTEARKQHERELAQALTPDDRRKAEENHRERLIAVNRDLVGSYGVYESSGIEVLDYHTQELNVPPAILAKLREREEKTPRKLLEDGTPPPFLQVLVNVERTSAAQMLGVARRDLYLLAAERPFWVNFFKGIVGLWILLLLVLGVAVACSTYLSGVISWLCTIFLIVAGMFIPDIQQIAEGKSVGGGPMEAAARLLKRTPQAAPLDDTPTTAVMRQVDDVYRWWLRRFLNIIPDVTRFDLHQYVANGFDIPLLEVLMLDNLLAFLGYLFPWAIVAYFLMQYREVANPT